MQLSFIAWLDTMVMLKLLIPSFPLPQPSPSFLGVLDHLFLTCLCFGEEMGEVKVRKEEIKRKGERLGWHMPNCKHAYTQSGYRKFPLIPLWEVTYMEMSRFRSKDICVTSLGPMIEGQSICYNHLAHIFRIYQPQRGSTHFWERVLWLGQPLMTVNTILISICFLGILSLNPQLSFSCSFSSLWRELWSRLWVPIQFASLEEEMATQSNILAWKNSMDREVWPAIVHGVTKSRTRPSTHQHVQGTSG